MQRLGPRRGLQHPPRADKQWILQALAQAGEGPGHSRLTKPQPAGRGRHAALLHQEVKHPEQVQIDRINIIFTHVFYFYYRFD